ncbi:MAG TPA: N-acetyl-alpha-D-glucosaminyl L-malate synthase BshA [Polyangia bacterium]|nr:N-acetyl-alpha-D-glucosaminyl L-malate synthase BshA [Polyangia bacterium]
MSAPPLSIGVACFSTFGGSGVVAAEVATALARRGHRVHVFSDAPPGRLQGGAVFHRVSAPAYPQLGHDLYTLALASSIIDVARTVGLDLVHAHYALPHAVSAELARQVREAEAPGRAPLVVTTLHGTDTTLVGIDPTFRPLTRFAVASSDAVTVPSAWLAEATRRNLELPAGFPIDVVPNFVDTARFAPAPAAAPPFLVHVSNFRPLKRVGDVVRIFARVRAGRAVRLRLIGDGPERAAVEALARELGVAGDVELVGEREDLPALLAGAAAFLLPSETESFGLAALEALAAGVPVVASRVGGLPEVVRDGEDGFLHAVGEVAAMAASAARLLDDAALRARLGAAARARAVAHFRAEPAVDRYEAVYARVLGRAGAAT